MLCILILICCHQGLGREDSGQGLSMRAHQSHPSLPTNTHFMGPDRFKDADADADTDAGADELSIRTQPQKMDDL